MEDSLLEVPSTSERQVPRTNVQCVQVWIAPVFHCLSLKDALAANAAADDGNNGFS